MLAVLFSLEYDSDVGTACGCGNETSLREWRCVDCTDQSVRCGPCLRDRHKYSPLHKVQLWNGRFFGRASLSDVGVELHLGHDAEACPNTLEIEAISMSIGDLNGFHTLRVLPCNCKGTGEEAQPLLTQLMRARLFPATLTSPRTAYTFRLMEHWHLDVMQGKKPVYDYYIGLRRLTDVVAKDLVRGNMQRSCNVHYSAGRVQELPSSRSTLEGSHLAETERPGPGNRRVPTPQPIPGLRRRYLPCVPRAGIQPPRKLEGPAERS